MNASLECKYTRWARITANEDANLQQLVRAQARKEYLLDLILSDLEALSNVEVLSPIADDSLVQMVIDINTVSSEASKRVDLQACKVTTVENPTCRDQMG